MQGIVVMLDQLIEAAPTRVFRRDFGPLDPAAVAVQKEIVLRFDGRIHVARINRLHALATGGLGGGRWLRLGLRRQDGKNAKAGCDQDKEFGKWVHERA